VTPLTLALARAERRLLARLEELDARLDDDATAWIEYRDTATALATLATRQRESGQLMTTAQLAEQFHVSSKTILRRKARGELQPAMQLSKRALRWRAP
jgi:hypothetical protein